jgi:hypothetical protein
LLLQDLVLRKDEEAVYEYEQILNGIQLHNSNLPVSRDANISSVIDTSKLDHHNAGRHCSISTPEGAWRGPLRDDLRDSGHLEILAALSGLSATRQL